MHIYGFGQLTDVKIKNINDFQVFYGENEAGKSTIMAFIHAILFGFPTKQQAALRYEPRHHAKFGGNITIFLENYGFTLIERVKGKTAAGDVSVTMENGTIGKEDLLKQLLSNVDKGLFQAIFSFNLQGLQNIHQMKGEEIGKYLFSAGTLGTERLTMADTELQKELDARFKPGGKKPILNEKLQDIHQLNNELKAAAARNQEYEKYIQQKESIQKEMAQLKELIQINHEKMEKINEWKKIQSLVKEEKWTENELRLIGEITFPARGIERYESLKPLLHSYEAQMISLKERENQLKNELELIQPNLSILKSENEIMAVLEKFPVYEQLKLQEKTAEMKLFEYEEKLSRIKEKLHLPLMEEEILTVNTNIFMKDQVEKISKNSQALKDVKQELDIRFNEEKHALEEIEEDIRYAQTKVMNDSERNELEEKVNEGMDRQHVEFKLHAVRDKIALYKKTAEQERTVAANLQKQKYIQFLLFGVFIIGLVMYGLFTNQSMLFIVSGLGIIVIVILFIHNYRQNANKQSDSTLTELSAEEKRLIQHLQSPEFNKVAELQQRIAVDNRYRDQMQILRIKLEQQQNHYEKVIGRFEQWELEAAKHKEEITNISGQLRIPAYIANSHLLEAFQLIEQFKTAAREKGQLLERMERIKRDHSQISHELCTLAEKFLVEKNGDLQKWAYLLKSSLKEEQEKSVQWKEKQTKLADLEADLLKLRQEHHHIEVELNQLLLEAKAENEEKFYLLGSKADKKTGLVEKLKELEKQLQYSLLSKSERDNYLQIHNGDEDINEHNKEAIALKSRLTMLQEQFASVKYEIQMLEEGGLYSELLHQYKQKKYEMEEDAKEWAVYSLAKDILLQTVEKYKNNHLPKMLSKAEEYLSFLTDGNYHKIVPHNSGLGFLIERKDQTIFEANELSQATTEQVYVSIRLALATTLYEKYCFPIIIDDSFVNFDAKRTKKVIELLKQLKRNQILFFTCHDHLFKYFQKDHLLYLHNGAILAAIE